MPRLRPGPRIVALFAIVASLVVGLAAPSHATVKYPFQQISASVSGVSVTVKTYYEGTGPVTLTIGTGANVAATAVKSVTVSRGFTNSYTLTATRLLAHTTYYYTLSAADAWTYTSPNPVHTPIRDVTVSYRTLSIISDGDGWPRGCGDFYFTFEMDYYNKYTSPMCLNDGDVVPVPNNHTGYAPGNLSSPDYKYNSIEMSFWAFDDDRCYCLAESDQCDGYFDWQSTVCGDLAYKYWNDDIVAAGTRHKYVEVVGEGVDVKTDYYLTVTYHW
jgi:hypothetical protein